MYAILYDNDGNIAITNDGKYFFFGGGKEGKEKDHPILWGKPEKYINKMYHEYQRVILKEYIKKYNKGKEVEEVC